MDLRRLVTRIADALGPGADASQIEAVTAAVLDTLDTVPGTLPGSAPPHQRVLVTAHGPDRPGLLARLAQTVADAEGSIVDIRQHLLHGHVSISMVVDLLSDRHSAGDLRKRLNEASRGTDLQVSVLDEALARHMHRV